MNLYIQRAVISIHRHQSLITSSSNPFVHKGSGSVTPQLVSSPLKMRATTTPDDMGALRDGITRMNVVDRSGAGSFAPLPEPRKRDSKDYRGRDVRQKKAQTKH
jgi:hypothetical protein